MKIVFTGGGTAGHISLNKALIPFFIKKGWEVHYIGSKTGMEKDIINDMGNVTYHSISTGKLRRFISLKNIADFFRVITGISDANRLIKKIKPNIVFSKGGFVSFPVVLASKLNKVPAITHESDMSLGLANKMSLLFCDTLLTTFNVTEKTNKKTNYIGAIVRNDLKEGNKTIGLNLCHFRNKKPVILVTGGSQGSKNINNAIRDNLKEITKSFNIIHLCGKGNLDTSIKNTSYCQFEFVSNELADLIAASDIVITRGGANMIFEFLSVEKPMLIIPLDKDQSRGDQIENAIYFEKKGYAKILYEKDITTKSLIKNINNIYNNKAKMVSKMNKQTELGTLESIVEIIEEKATI